MDDEILKALSGMFSDKRFVPNGPYTWKATVNGTKIGVVVGSKGPRFTNYALGKLGNDRVVGAKEKNIIDVACVVFADGDNAVTCSERSAGELRREQPNKSPSAACASGRG